MISDNLKFGKVGKYDRGEDGDVRKIDLCRAGQVYIQNNDLDQGSVSRDRGQPTAPVDAAENSGGWNRHDKAKDGRK